MKGVCDGAQHSASTAVFIGVDVGGTTIKVGIVDDNGRSLSKSVVPTEVKQPPEIGMANLERCVRDAVQQSGLTMDDMHSVGLATPGTMDIAAGMLLTPGNLPAWHGFQIRQHVQNRLQKPTVLQNDANAAAFGEFWVGTARDAPSRRDVDARHGRRLRDHHSRRRDRRPTFARR